MIAHLQGKILKTTDKGIILSTGAVGYFVYLSENDYQEGQEVALFTHHHVKEDHSDLFGFKTYEDLQFFQQLLSVSGVGPKLALDILSVPQDQVKGAILHEDEAFICKIPGIGKKTAKRIIIDLKDKIEALETRPYQGLQNDPHPDATDALVKLGYNRKDIEQILQTLPAEITAAEDIITYFLKNA